MGGGLWFTPAPPLLPQSSPPSGPYRLRAEGQRFCPLLQPGQGRMTAANTAPWLQEAAE